MELLGLVRASCLRGCYEFHNFSANLSRIAESLPRAQPRTKPRTTPRTTPYHDHNTRHNSQRSASKLPLDREAPDCKNVGRPQGGLHPASRARRAHGRACSTPKGAKGGSTVTLSLLAQPRRICTGNSGMGVGSRISLGRPFWPPGSPKCLPRSCPHRSKTLSGPPGRSPFCALVFECFLG